MPLAMVRVDSRLIHGQVIETWLPHTGANCILVVNDDLAANPCMRAVMELAVPQTVHAVFCRLEETAEALAEIDRRGERAILLCASSEDALRLYRSGIRYVSLNIGNLHFATGKVEVTPSVYFSPADFEAVHCLRHQGVSVSVRATPFEAGLSLEPDR